MTVTDFTKMMRDAELPPQEPIFEKITRTDIIPDLEIAVYQSPDSSDYYYATREVCALVGFCKNWLTMSLRRQSTIDQLRRLGFEVPLPQITVKMGRIKKPVQVLTRTDFMALVEYAKNAGNKDAIALYRTLQILGLHKIAGIQSKAEDIGGIYKQINLLQDQQA